MGRRLGQHFLADSAILKRIADAACPARVPLVIEIGPGRGALTAPLLERADRVVAIEVDPVLVYYLRQKFKDQIDAGRLVLVEGDVLKTDLSAWGCCVIAGNVPYYISSPILERVLAARGTWGRAVFLVQAEVADRLTAVPGTRDYGYLSVFVQVQARVERLFEVSRGSFRPPPKVDSALVQLEPREPEVPDLGAFLKFASDCFRQKRKTLRNNLIPVYGRERVEAVIDQRTRAEHLSVGELAGIWQKLRQ